MLRLVATLSVVSVTTAFAPLAAPLLIHRHPHRHHRVLCQARASPPQPDATDAGASQLERSSLREADVALSKELLGGGAIAGPVVVAALLAFPELALASDAYPWAGPVRLVLDPALNLGQFWMLLRVVMSWYPEVNLNKLPYNLVAWPTEPILKPTRQVVPPAFGVDISPIIWIAILSFFREILFGQQGLFNMMDKM